jgi:protein-disulfide isomerase
MMILFVTAAIGMFFVFTTNPQIFAQEGIKEENGSLTQTSHIYEGLGIKIKYFDPWFIVERPDEPNCSNICVISLHGAMKGGNKEDFANIVIVQNVLNGPKIKDECKCDTLLEYVKYEYENDISKHDDFVFINDNQTTLTNDNKSAIQLEYEFSSFWPERKVSTNKVLTIFTKDNNSFYNFFININMKEQYSKYVDDFKKMIDSLQFVSSNESKQKQPSFMMSENTTESNILKKQTTSISPKEPNEGSTLEELVNETIALENQTIDSQIDKISKDNNNPMISTKKDKENRTFGDCYSGTVGSLLLASMFTPYTIDLNDREMKKFLSNMCNFYFDKTGIWINIPENNNLTTKYGQEFYNKYGNTMPESLKQFSEYPEQFYKSEEIAKANNTLDEEQDALDPEMVLNKLLNPSVANASVLGNDQAKITIVEFADYQCPFCVQFNKETKNPIIKNFVDTGKAKFLYKDLIVNDGSDKASTLAAASSYCAAEQGMYWAYHDELFKNSNGENTGWVTKDNLKQFANNVRVPDLMKFSDCVDTGKYNDVVRENDSFARNIGLTNPPSFIFYNGTTPVAIQGAQPYEVFEQIITAIE